MFSQKQRRKPSMLPLLQLVLPLLLLSAAMKFINQAASTNATKQTAIDANDVGQNLSKWLSERDPYIRSLRSQTERSFVERGGGQIVVSTREGSLLVATDASAVIVFGDEVPLTVVRQLLKARIATYDNGKGLMSGDVSVLCCVAIGLLADVAHPDSLFVLSPLLQDPDPNIRRYAACSIVMHGWQVEDLRPLVAKVTLPKEAKLEIHRLCGSDGVPDWVTLQP